MNKDNGTDVKVDCELFYKCRRYNVQLIGTVVTVLEDKKHLYMGTWNNVGSYVVYPGDTKRTNYNWKLLDKIDLALRNALRICPSPLMIDRPDLNSSREESVTGTQRPRRFGWSSD